MGLVASPDRPPADTPQAAHPIVLEAIGPGAWARGMYTGAGTECPPVRAQSNALFSVVLLPSPHCRSWVAGRGAHVWSPAPSMHTAGQLPQPSTHAHRRGGGHSPGHAPRHGAPPRLAPRSTWGYHARVPTMCGARPLKRASHPKPRPHPHTACASPRTLHDQGYHRARHPQRRQGR